MTRNTKIYKMYFNKGQEKKEIYYRDLNTLELAFLSNIKNDTIRLEMAGVTALYNCDASEIPIGIKIQIGEKVIETSQEIINDMQLLEVYVTEFRTSIKSDDVMMCLKYILSILPGQSFTDLLKLNFKDLIELVCLCEDITGKNIFKFGGKKGINLINPHTLDDDGQSLQQKMDSLNSHLGASR